MYALEIEGLDKTYKNGFHALKGIDLAVEEGDFFALLGPNGAGKSTTIGVITSLVNKTYGRVRVFEHDIDLQPAQVKASIGLVPQEFNFNLFEPVQEIVVNQAGYYGISRREALPRAEQSLRQLDLWDKRRSEARQLSGGMKRRLMIARALVHRPRLLILDEPTAGVDIEIRHSMWRFLKKINEQGTTIILTTHYLEEAESLCRNIAVIDHGRIVEHTAMAELLRRLDSETFVLNLAGEIDQVPSLEGYTALRLDPWTLEVAVPQARGLSGLFRLLSAQGIEVLSLRNKQNRLEQWFIDRLDNSDRSSTGRKQGGDAV
jgi:ABC-2 type transport system ATP-binding protein